MERRNDTRRTNPLLVGDNVFPIDTIKLSYMLCLITGLIVGYIAGQAKQEKKEEPPKGKGLKQW